MTGRCGTGSGFGVLSGRSSATSSAALARHRRVLEHHHLDPMLSHPLVDLLQRPRWRRIQRLPERVHRILPVGIRHQFLGRLAERLQLFRRHRLSYQRRLISSIIRHRMRWKAGLSLELINRRWYHTLQHTIGRAAGSTAVQNPQLSIWTRLRIRSCPAWRSRWSAARRRSRSGRRDRRWSPASCTARCRRSSAWCRAGSCRSGSWAGGPPRSPS